jgi:hypothetical protein
MTEKVLISIIAIAMLTLTLIKGDKRTIWLTSILTLGILIAWIDIPMVKPIGMIVYSISALLIALSAFQKDNLDKTLRISIFITGVWALGTNLFALMHWPFANEVRISLVIPIVLYLISLYRGLIKRKELGYMTILNSIFLFDLIR